MTNHFFVMFRFQLEMYKNSNVCLSKHTTGTVFGLCCLKGDVGPSGPAGQVGLPGTGIQGEKVLINLHLVCNIYCNIYQHQI